MALIEYDVYKQKLRDLEPELKKLGDALDIDAVAQEAARLEDETTQDGFWNNLERSQKVQTRLKQLQNKLHRYHKLMSTWEDLTTLCEMGQEAEDEEILEELKTEFPALETEIEEIRMTTLLSGEYDANNVILQLHSGAGGTEAQDWCQMLYRMYTRWAERHGYSYKILDYLDGDEAGIKSVTFEVSGDHAYGYLRGEKGVHRLVRISPFDANARRHTSFASLDVAPMLEDEDKMLTDKAGCRARAYDIVLNGTELGGGSIRINTPEMQEKAFQALGISEEDIQERFGHLVNAFQYGAPPHGGLAYGLDRLVMLMTGASSIRDVIAFPKVQNASDLMMNCPDVVDDKQLDDLSIAVTRMEETPAEDEV